MDVPLGEVSKSSGKGRLRSSGEGELHARIEAPPEARGRDAGCALRSHRHRDAGQRGARGGVEHVDELGIDEEPNPPPPPPPPPPGDEGCTPGFWKNHPGAFAGTGVMRRHATTLASVGFDVSATLTFGQALRLRGGGLNALLRHAAAAYLNAASPNVAYPLTTTHGVRRTNNAIASGQYELTEEPVRRVLRTWSVLGSCD